MAPGAISSAVSQGEEDFLAALDIGDDLGEYHNVDVRAILDVPSGPALLDGPTSIAHRARARLRWRLRMMGFSPSEADQVTDDAIRVASRGPDGAVFRTILPELLPDRTGRPSNFAAIVSDPEFTPAFNAMFDQVLEVHSDTTSAWSPLATATDGIVSSAISSLDWEAYGILAAAQVADSSRMLWEGAYYSHFVNHVNSNPVPPVPWYDGGAMLRAGGPAERSTAGLERPFGDRSRRLNSGEQRIIFIGPLFAAAARIAGGIALRDIVGAGAGAVVGLGTGAINCPPGNKSCRAKAVGAGMLSGGVMFSVAKAVTVAGI